MILEWITPGAPIGQPRARASVVWIGRKPQAIVYDDKKHPVNEYKKAIVSGAMDVIVGPEPLTCGVGIEMTFVQPRPKNITWVRKPMPRVVCLDVPDIDNLEKAVLDALSKIVWRDDRQVFGLRSSKWYAAGHETPHTKVTIYTTVEEFFHEQAGRVDGGELQANRTGPGSIREDEGHLHGAGGQ